ncbi:MAG: hypothetical protein M3460_29785 [Actinomycetota bacterium]|nr:hypothetical protein [Actinomycetota bacterium]
MARQALIAKAENITGHATSFSGTPKVTIKRAKDNEPVPGLLVKFVTGSRKLEGCSASTDMDGVAECDSGTRFDPAFVMDALTSGYDAVFDGNDEYSPVKAHGSVTPGF